MTSQLDLRSGGLAILIGSPRSGTTWLAKIVDSHPAVLYRHEPDSINVRPDIPFVPQSQAVASWLDTTRNYLETLQDERASKSSGSQPVFAKNYRSWLGDYIHRGFIYAVKGGEKLLGNPPFLGRFQIPDLVRAQSDEDKLVFIKSVSSLCRTYMFSLACPDMRFVHIIRHPCAYVASTLRGKKLGLLSDDAYIDTLAGMPEGASYGLSIEVLRAMTREEQLAARWMLQNEKVALEMDGNPRYKRVIYEELCSHPQAVADDLFDFLGLEMSDQTRKFIEQSSAGKSEDVRYFDVQRDSARAATGWTAELSADQIDRIRRVVSNSGLGRVYFPEATS
jgi:hypothetical protein